MDSLRILIATTLALILSPSAHAGTYTTTATISLFHYYEGHNGLLIQQPTIINPDGCARTDFYTLRKDHPSYKEITALLMAAQMSNQPVALYLNGCYESMPSITGVQSRK